MVLRTTTATQSTRISFSCYLSPRQNLSSQVSNSKSLHLHFSAFSCGLSTDLSPCEGSSWDKFYSECFPRGKVPGDRFQLLHRGSLRWVFFLDSAVHHGGLTKQWGRYSVPASWATIGKRTRILLLSEVQDLQLVPSPKDHFLPQSERVSSWESLRRAKEASWTWWKRRIGEEAQEAENHQTSDDNHGC